MELKFEGPPLNHFQQIIGALVLKHCQGKTTITIEELTDVKGIIMYFEDGEFKIKSFAKEKNEMEITDGEFKITCSNCKKEFIIYRKNKFMNYTESNCPFCNNRVVISH